MEAIIEERSPLHRHIEADDVGAPPVFSLRRRGNVTGTTLYVDSGYQSWDVTAAERGAARRNALDLDSISFGTSTVTRCQPRVRSSRPRSST